MTPRGRGEDAAKVNLPPATKLSAVLYDAAQKYQKDNEAEILGGYEIEEYMAEKVLEFLIEYREEANTIRGRR